MDAEEYRRMAAAGRRHWWYESTRRLLAQMLEPHLPTMGGGAIVLDAGGGTGATGGWMTRHALVVLADYEMSALAVARQEHDPLRPVRVDLNHLPFADGSFDAVVCVTALCHRMNSDPAALVADYARVVRPGGIVCLMEPGGKRLWRGHDEITHTARRFSLGELRSMAQAAGLDVVRSTAAYSFLVPPALVMQLAERGQQTSDVGRNETGLGGVLGAVAAAERRLLRRFDLPFGLSVLTVARKPDR